MNETLRTLIRRSSCRQFLDKEIPEDALNEIVEAGLYAPTAMGRQESAAIVITNKKVINDLEEVNAKVMGRNGHPFYGAPVVILIIAKGPTAIYDGSAMIMNMLNAAESLNIGSCWIHRAKEELETEFGRKLLEENGFDSNEYVGIGHVILGYRSYEPKERAPRKEGRAIYIK